MFLLWLKLSATHILLPQQTYLNVIERKYKRQILMPDPIILDLNNVDMIDGMNSWAPTKLNQASWFRNKDNDNIEVIPVNWTQKFEPHGGQISKP